MSPDPSEIRGRDRALYGPPPARFTASPRTLSAGEVRRLNRRIRLLTAGIVLAAPCVAFGLWLGWHGVLFYVAADAAGRAADRIVRNR